MKCENWHSDPLVALKSVLNTVMDPPGGLKGNDFSMTELKG